jgi:pyruvate/2-oxoglutarate dehydrogenase complex dihydrolipoamide acyltransferase (E2) component
LIYQLSVPAAVPGVDEIRILEWHVAPGDAVTPGDLIVELETHKAVVEVRAGQPGALRAVLAEPGDWRGIGLALAVFSDQPEELLPATPESMGDAIGAMVVDFEIT